MWVHCLGPFLCLKTLFMMLFIRDLSKSCGMEVYRVEKSNVSMEVALTLSRLGFQKLAQTGVGGIPPPLLTPLLFIETKPNFVSANTIL